MKTRTIEITTWKINDTDIPDNVREKAIEQHCDINVDYDWWDGVFDDASRVGLDITGFDIDRTRHIDYRQGMTAEDSANAIVVDHGNVCDTWKTAKAYLDTVTALELEYPSEDDEYELEQAIDKAADEYWHDLSEDYLSVLWNEYEYLTSEEAIVETLTINEYDFDENGHIA